MHVKQYDVDMSRPLPSACPVRYPRVQVCQDFVFNSKPNQM